MNSFVSVSALPLFPSESEKNGHGGAGVFNVVCQVEIILKLLFTMKLS